jgi:hypothetical protein
MRNSPHMHPHSKAFAVFVISPSSAIESKDKEVPAPSNSRQYEVFPYQWQGNLRRNSG